MPDTGPLVVTKAEAARMLGVTHQVILRMIASGQIPAEKVVTIGRLKKINRRFLLTLAGEDMEVAVAAK